MSLIGLCAEKEMRNEEQLLEHLRLQNQKHELDLTNIDP